MASYASRLRALPPGSLTLSFDLNGTLLATDHLSGKSLEDCLHGNLSAVCRGVVAEATWSGKYGPGDHTTTETCDFSLLPSYDDFLAALFALPCGKGGEAQRAQQRSRRNALRHGFARDGHPGQRWSEWVAVQQNALRAPHSWLREDDGEGVVKTEQRHLLPSFFHLVNTLSVADRAFSLVFRTFGSDLGSALAEWRQFVEGRHPLAKPEGSILQKMGDDSRAAFPRSAARPHFAACYRDGEGVSWLIEYRKTPIPKLHVECAADGSKRVWLDDSSRNTADLIFFPTTEAALRSLVETGQRLRQWSDAALAAWMRDGGSVLGIVDYYHYWFEEGEQGAAGKLFPVVLPTTPSLAESITRKNAVVRPERWYQLFFDDHLNFPRRQPHSSTSAVAFYDARSGALLEDDVAELFGCSVKTIDAILDLSYYVQNVTELLEAQAKLWD